MSLEGSRVKLVLLGSAQDGGIPHPACGCEQCTRARAGDDPRRKPTSLGLYLPNSEKRYLIDVTPQLGRQLELFDQHTPDNWDLRRPVDGVLLTHGHFGHIGGLPYFGREVANTEGLPVWCTRSLRNYLRMNRPYRDLIRHGNIELKRLLAGEPFVLNSTCRVLPLEVPHRTDVTDTVAFFITGLRGSLLYLPDVDQLTNEIQALIARADYALIDGTFYRSDELGDRPMHEVPHPVIAESTAELLADERLDPANIWFIHLNHTNPAAAGSSQPYRELTAEGFNVAVDGETWEI